MNKRFLSLLLIFTFVLSFLPVYADDITPGNLNEPNISINENDTNETIEETTINEEITIVPEEDDEPDEEVGSTIPEPDISIQDEVVEEPIEGTEQTDSENGEILEDEELPDVETTEKEETTKTLEDEEELKTESKTVESTSTNDEIVGVKFNYNKYNTQDSKIEDARITIEEENPAEKPVDENINELETDVVTELYVTEQEENISVDSVEVIDEATTESMGIQFDDTEYNQDLIEYLNNNANNYADYDNETTYSLQGNRSSSEDNVEEMSVEVVNNPYFGQMINGAAVSLSTGALNYEKTLLSIPGRNGLDVILKIRYNSDSSVVPYNSYESLAYESIKSFNNFAVGWSFDMTHVHMPIGRYGYMYSKPVLTMKNGSSYEMDYTYSSTATEPSVVTLKNYKLNDVRVTLQYNPDQFKVEYSDGIIDYIDEQSGN